ARLVAATQARFGASAAASIQYDSYCMLNSAARCANAVSPGATSATAPPIASNCTVLFGPGPLASCVTIARSASSESGLVTYAEAFLKRGRDAALSSENACTASIDDSPWRAGFIGVPA